MRLAVALLLGIGFSLNPYQLAIAEVAQEREQPLCSTGALVWPSELLRACCNVYCPKPQPCIPCFSRGCGIGYCPKPLPCVPCFAAGCSENCYCPKPCPDLCRPIGADDYRCAEARTDCATSRAYAADPTFAPAESYADDTHIQVD
jgi:hypothetical protein